ncbi:MAG: 4-alpha-glucanotransferase [Oscillospiraceae bacterium]|nr:4-alpha-glucanotransferase [Candidatus Equicaccousia limihippi]
MTEPPVWLPVAGVPPDYFAADGQLWGNPVYDWEYLKSHDCEFLKNRIKDAAQLYDMIRLDHFRAFSRFWAVPADAVSAKDGKFYEGGGKQAIDTVISAAQGKKIIAENLGIIDGDVDALLNYSGFSGMAVFQFGFDGNPHNPHLPHNYTQKTVAYTGTHDNNTLLGFMWEQPEDIRKQVMDYVGFVGDFNQSYESIVRSLLASTAEMVILPAQDLLGFGGDTRINTPGTANGNWSFRLSPDGFEKLNAEHFYKLNHTYGRAK